jgi:DNA-binding PadR family transcriptional regulator
MDVRTICLGILTRGDATGYEIKKLFEEDGYQHFVEASFGSIYPALGRLTEEGLVLVREEAQEKRPDRKVYSITPRGRAAFIGALMKPLPEDKHRSPFVFAMLFAHLLPQAHVSAMLDAYIGQVEGKLGQLNEQSSEPKTDGERFVSGFGRAVYDAILKFLHAHRAEIENGAVKAAAE